MKTSVLFIFACIFLVNISDSRAQQGVQIGLVFQPSLQTMRPAWLSSSGDKFDPDFNQTIRAAIGAQLDYHFSPYVGVGLNVEYSAQGQKFLVSENNAYKAHYYKFNYIKIPFYLSFNTSGKARLVGHIGPQVLVLMAARDKYDTKNHDITDNYAPLNLGFNFNLGIGFMLNNNLMVTAAPNFDLAFLNYNYTTDEAESAYLGKSPVTTTFGLQLILKYVKNEISADDAVIKVN